MDPASCRVIYIDDRFPAEKWLTRDTVSSPTTSNRINQALALDVAELPLDLQANVNATLAVFNQVFVCNSGRSFSAKLAEIQESVKSDCTPILALFDVDSDTKHDHLLSLEVQKSKSLGTHTSTLSPGVLKRQLTFSSEADESYGLQLLSRIASDLQVDEADKLVIPVALVRTMRKMSSAATVTPTRNSYHGKDSSQMSTFDDKPSPVDSHMMLQCLDAGALDVVPSPLNNEKIMGLTVHAYRIYKTAKKEQSAFLASASNFVAAARRRKQSWVGIEDEKPYAYLREAMVKKLLKGICEPEKIIEDYQHRDLNIEEDRKDEIMKEVGKWAFCAHDFSEDELVYAGYYILDHALKMPEAEHWRMSQDEILRFMQASRIAYNSFVLYHNFRHAVDVLQSLFYFLVQIGAVPPYPVGSDPPPLSSQKSPIAQLLSPSEAITLLISAIGHDVGHPGVNNMFLVKLNAPLAQLYNDQSVLEAFHCAAYSQILRRHWPSVFADKSLRQLLISSILATDMGVHSDYMQQLGLLQEKIHESKTTDGWAPKDIDATRKLVCGLLIKCADISNVARPWMVAERWTHLLQQEFASQGEMEDQVGMETTLFGGPPEIGNIMKLANGQIGFMGIFAHPLFANVTDVIPAMGFAAAEIANNKSVWINRIEQEKRRQLLTSELALSDGAISPRSQSPAPRKLDKLQTSHSSGGVHSPSSPLRHASNPPSPLQQKLQESRDSSVVSMSQVLTGDSPTRNRSELSSWKLSLMGNVAKVIPGITSVPPEVPPTSSGVFPSAKPQFELQRPEVQTRRSSHAVPRSLQLNGVSESHDESTTTTTSTSSSEHGEDMECRNSDFQKSNYTTTSIPLIYDDSTTDLPHQHALSEQGNSSIERFPTQSEYADNSAYTPTANRSSAPNQPQARHSGRISVPSTTDSNSMATSGGQTTATNLSTIFSHSTTEAKSFLSADSSDEQVDDRDRDPSHGSEAPAAAAKPGRARRKSSTLPEVVPSSNYHHVRYPGRGAPTSSSSSPPSGEYGAGQMTSGKSAVKTSASLVRESGSEAVTSSWEEGESDRSIRRRMSRFKFFWKKKSDED